MKAIVSFIVSLIVTGIAGMFCLFSCLLAANKDTLWERNKKK